jgi:hypothetical protein
MLNVCSQEKTLEPQTANKQLSSNIEVSSLAMHNICYTGDSFAPWNEDFIEVSSNQENSNPSKTTQFDIFANFKP